MIPPYTLLISMCILQCCVFGSTYTRQLIICGHSEYNFEENMIGIAYNLGYQVRNIYPSSKCDLQTTLAKKSSSNAVINFDVKNFGHVDFSFMGELDKYDGFMVIDHYGTIDKALPKCKDIDNRTDFYERGCKDAGFNKFTKLFIGSFDDHQPLYNVYNAITNDFIKKEDIFNDNVKQIVVCTDGRKSCPRSNKQEFIVSCERCYTQFECNRNTLAIIAPSPEKLKTCDEKIPVIFYDTIYIEPNSVGTVYKEQHISNFKTSTTMMHWKALASSVTDYILKIYPWPRVAIVSDDSQLSHYMTNNQKKYLEDVKALFTIIQDCVEERDFKEAFTFLDKFRSRVIIVNVAKHNLNKMTKGAKAAGLTDANIIWVFPGHRETDIKDFKFRAFTYLECNLHEVVHWVVDRYSNTSGDLLSVEKMFRQNIINNRPSESYQAPTCSYVPRFIPYKLPSMDLGNCALITSNYFYYCADWNVLYLILVIIVFLGLIFVVLLLFNHIQMKTLAYKPLHKPPSLWRQLLRRERPPQQRQGFLLRRRYWTRYNYI